MSPVSRGFHHLRPASEAEQGRVPPGQHVTEGFPVLSAGPTPHTPLSQWTFSITRGGATEKSWTWPELRALPAETVTVDISCVTRWTKLGTQWRAGRAGARRPGPAACPAPLLLEERQVGTRPRTAR